VIKALGSDYTDCRVLAGGCGGGRGGGGSSSSTLAAASGWLGHGAPATIVASMQPPPSGGGGGGGGSSVGDGDEGAVATASHQPLAQPQQGGGSSPIEGATASEGLSMVAAAPSTGWSQQVQWEWRTAAGWRPYELSKTATIERAYARWCVFCSSTSSGTSSDVPAAAAAAAAAAAPAACELARCSLGDGRRHVDFGLMRQVVSASPGRTRQVRRQLLVR
jgi:hypothetical protein